MPLSSHDSLKSSIKAADGLYHRLVLLAGENKSDNSAVLRDIAYFFGTHVINVNLSLSAKLLELTKKERIFRLPEIMTDLTNSVPSPVIMDKLEILFDRNLEQDPLRLLQGISRNRTIAASWSGQFSGGKLIYAEPWHEEYRCCDSADVLIVCNKK